MTERIELWNKADIANYMGVQGPAVQNWYRNGMLPEPVAYGRRGSVAYWTPDQIKFWKRTGAPPWYRE